MLTKGHVLSDGFGGVTVKLGRCGRSLAGLVGYFAS